MRQHLADLRVTAAAIDAAHEIGEPLAAGDEAGRPAFGEAAEIDELNVQTTMGGGGLEHLALQGDSQIPCRLAAHGGVEREDETPPPLADDGRDLARLIKKSVDGRRARHARRIMGRSAHDAAFPVSCRA